MPKDVAVITIHGMGSTVEEYHKPLERKLRRAIGENTWDQKVHLESVYYQNLLQGNQEDVWEDMNDRYGLRWDFLRKYMLFSFSDAASIEHSLQGDQQLYKAVHQTIATAFDKALVALDNDPTRPVIVVAQSLGAEQVSNYIWDAQVGKRLFEPPLPGTAEQQAFRSLQSCSHLVTTGCNIPIFKAGLSNPTLFDRPNANFEWHNYFDRDDVLGFPMRTMGPSFAVDWLKDEEISVGDFLTGWNPLSHLQYWTDKDLIRPLRGFIQGHL